METPHWTVFIKKVITSTNSTSSNSSGFNPILQKFYKMICEIIVSKTVSEIFLIFCWSSFINNFMAKNSFSEPKKSAKMKYLETHLFKKIPAHLLVGLICTNMREGFFFWKKISLRTWSFFHDFSTTTLGVIFLNKKIIVYFFSRVSI